MSGAAGIAAAKNRRSKTEIVAKPPVVNCKNVNGSACALPANKSRTAQPNAPAPNKAQVNLVDPDSLQIRGALPPGQILMIHEQRLNKLYERLNQRFEAPLASCLPLAECDEECYDKINELELKIHMLEEVIMNLQLTITNVQSFTMETSLAMLKLQNTFAVAPVALAVPASLVPAPVAPVALVPAPVAVPTASLVLEPAPLADEPEPIIEITSENIQLMVIA